MSKVITQFYRGKVIESTHNIKCYIGSTNGRIIFSTGNENDYIYPRSSIKIFQAIPFALSNGFDVYNLNKKQIALSCSSHCGENFHINELENWIKKRGKSPFSRLFKTIYFTESTTALNASGLFIAKSARVFLFNSIPLAFTFPMNSE